MHGVQAFFDGDFYGAYPGADLSADPFLSLVNGSSGVGMPLSLTGLVANVSGSQVSSMCIGPARCRIPLLNRASSTSPSMDHVTPWMGAHRTSAVGGRTMGPQGVATL
jgi:hypothetical protein